MMLRTVPEGGAVLSNGLQREEFGNTEGDAALKGCRVGEELKVIDNDDISEEVDTIRYVASSMLDDVICSVADDVIIFGKFSDVICEETDDLICKEVCEKLADEVVKFSAVRTLLCITDDWDKSWLVTELEVGTVLVETAEVLDTKREVVFGENERLLIEL